MKKILLSVLGGVVLLGSVFGASAATIFGDVVILSTSGVTVDNDTRSIDFGSNSYVASVSTPELAPMLDSSGTLTMPVFNYPEFGFSGALNPSKTIWEFSVSGKSFSFTLDAVSNVSKQGTGLQVQGTGTLAASGYESNTQTSFNLQVGKGFQLSITEAAAVPIPAAGWLFGSALVGLVGVSRRRRGFAASNA